jgi:hypothetical protein
VTSRRNKLAGRLRALQVAFAPVKVSGLVLPGTENVRPYSGPVAGRMGSLFDGPLAPRPEVLSRRP